MSDQVRDLKPRGVKPPVQLVPFVLVELCAAAFEHGANKYAPWNWALQGDMEDMRETYSAALVRHVGEFVDLTRSDFDLESGVSHLGHALACIGILAFHLGHGYKEPNTTRALRGLAPHPEVPPPLQAPRPEVPTPSAGVISLSGTARDDTVDRVDQPFELAGVVSADPESPGEAALRVVEECGLAEKTLSGNAREGVVDAIDQAIEAVLNQEADRLVDMGLAEPDPEGDPETIVVSRDLPDGRHGSTLVVRPMSRADVHGVRCGRAVVACELNDAEYGWFHNHVQPCVRAKPRG